MKKLTERWMKNLREEIKEICDVRMSNEIMIG